MKLQVAWLAVADEDLMGRVLLDVVLPGRLIGPLAFVLVGEAVLPAARMDEEAHQAAARTV
jgi:hypothetical protein